MQMLLNSEFVEKSGATTSKTSNSIYVSEALCVNWLTPVSASISELTTTYSFLSEATSCDWLSSCSMSQKIVSLGLHKAPNINRYLCRKQGGVGNAFP